MTVIPFVNFDLKRKSVSLKIKKTSKRRVFVGYDLNCQNLYLSTIISDLLSFGCDQRSISRQRETLIYGKNSIFEKKNLAKFHVRFLNISKLTSKQLQP